jgi:NhaP-type Na+/H+ or K+/H+ antiporter
MVARRLLGPTVTEHAELAEDVSQVGAAVVFLLFGAIMVWPALDSATPLIVLCAIGTLTLGRMIPVAIATIGTGLMRETVLFLGWFGPRGLASMLFGLLLLAENEVDRPDELFGVISLVVFLSVVLHGVTASPGATRYAAWFDDMAEEDDDMMEAEPVPESPVRWITSAARKAQT